MTLKNQHVQQIGLYSSWTPIYTILLIVFLCTATNLISVWAAPPVPLSPSPALSTVWSSASQVLPERKAPFAGLRVVPSAGIQSLAPNQVQHDFGPVGVLDTPRLEQNFILHNGSATPLALDRLQPTCHCTTATVEGASGDAPLPTLAPGQQAVIHVAVSLAGLAPGPLLKSVLVFTKGDPRPAAVLTLIGQLKPAVTLLPSLLDFGQTAVNKPQALSLTATLDPRLMENGTLPILASNNPDIQITPQPDVISRLKPNLTPTVNPKPTVGPSGKLTASSPSQAFKRRTYRVTLSSSAAGPITGSLYFVSSGRNPTASAALATATVLLVGQVVGDVAAQPQALSFGTVRLGQGTTRQIVLVGKTGEALKSLKVASASAWLSAKLVGNDPRTLFTSAASSSSDPAVQTNQQTNQVLEVTLGPDAPAGTLQSRIKVSLANGQRLLIPVTAYVSAAPMP